MIYKTRVVTSNFFNKLWKQTNLITFRTKSTLHDDVIFEINNNVGIITLNRPKVLNTLHPSMVDKILQVLKEWESQRNFVLIKGTGEKSFCAGGDVRAIVEGKFRGERWAHSFFRKEYITNALVGNYKIPYVALIDGIVMGGGVGMSVHSPYRICTERTLFAMPETAIGFFPDVGVSYIFPRLQGKLGFYLALTGARLKGSDVLKAGIATHYIESKNLKNLEQALLSCKDHNSIKLTLNEMCSQDNKEFSLKQYLDKINKCFSGNTMEEIITLLKQDGSDFAKNTIEVLNQMSPTSMKVSLKLLQMGSKLDTLQECLQLDYRAALGCFSHHDFYEGVRALLIDKDKKPKWKPASLEEVSEELVDSHFSKLPENEDFCL